MIDPTDEMADAFRRAEVAYWEAREATAEGMTVAEHGRAAYRAGLAAAFGLVERDYDLVPKPIVHLRVNGDWHVHCCGMEIGALPRGDDVTLDPHGVTCKGPS